MPIGRLGNLWSRVLSERVGADFDAGWPAISLTGHEAFEPWLSAAWGCGNRPLDLLWRRSRRGSERTRGTGARPCLNRTVVMGSAVGLRPDQVKPLLASLHNCGYSGDVVLFVSRRLRRQLHQDPLARGVHLVRRRSLLPLSFRQGYGSRTLWALWRPVQVLTWTIIKLIGRLPLPVHARLVVQAAIARAVCTPMEARFFHYLRFLSLQPYERVVLTDVRDVLFQRDPSPDTPAEGLAVGIETRRYTIASEPHNRMWVRDAFGPEVVAQIGASPVSCVGVTYGDIRAVSSYLDLMTREILRLSAKAARTGGADTAIHNVLLWTNQLGDVQPLETLASPLATLNGISADEVKLSSRGSLLNADGSEPCIVHQYDRVPGLAPTLLRTLAAEKSRCPDLGRHAPPPERAGDYTPAP
jgi:hypothetical protein